MYRTLVFLFEAVILSAACSDPSQPVSIPAVAVAPATQWSGGQVTLRSSYFVGRNPLPPILASGDPLPAVRMDDSTVSVSLPRGATGPVALFIAHDGRVDSVASVQRIGFREKRQLTPALAGTLLTADSADHPMVLGNVDGDNYLAEPVGRIDLVSGVGLVFSGIVGPSEYYYGLSPSTPAGTYAVRDSTDSIRLARLLVSPPAIVGTAPCWQPGPVRQVSRLSPGMWLYTDHHSSVIYAEADGCSQPRFEFQMESPWGVFLSPRGDRTALAVYYVFQGYVPVFDNVAGDTAFTLPLQGTLGIAFSPDGARLFAVGGLWRSDSLVVVDATAGKLLAPQVGLPEYFSSFSLAYSTTGGGRLLAAVADLSVPSVLALLVYDATTLKLEGVLTTPDDCGASPRNGPCFNNGVVAVDDVRHVAHIVIPGSPAALVFTFDLLQ